MNKTPNPKDWVYRFTYDDLVFILGFEPDFDGLALIDKALGNSRLSNEFYTIVASTLTDNES